MISQHLATATILGPDSLPLAELKVKGGRFTLDEKSAVFATAVLTLAMPDEATMALLDPRGTPPRIRLELQRVYNGPLPIAAVSSRYAGDPLSAVSESYQRPVERPQPTLAEFAGDFVNHWNGFPSPDPEPPLACVLYLSDARENYATDELTVNLAGPEMLLIQDVASGEAPYHPGAVSLNEVVMHVLTVTIPAGAGLISDGVQPLVDPEASEWKAGSTAWEYLRGMVEQAGSRLWADVNGTFHLQRDARSDNAPHEFTPANAKTMERILSRGGTWGDAVLVIYEWEDANGDRQTRRDYAKSVPDPTKPRVFRRNVPYPGPGAAAHLLRLVLSRGQDIALTAVSDYRLLPGDIALITLPSGDYLAKTIAAVDYSIGDDEMTVTVRDQITEGDAN